MCVLHRKFLASGRLDKKFERSRTQCVQSAMDLLSLQVLLYDDARTPDGTLHFTRHWYQYTFTSETFITAAMILCLDVKHTCFELASASPDLRSPPETYQLEGIFAALNRAYQIWDDAKKCSVEAFKIRQVLSRMLAKSCKWASLRLPEMPTAIFGDASDLLPTDATDSGEITNDSFEMDLDLDIDWVSENHGSLYPANMLLEECMDFVR